MIVETPVEPAHDKASGGFNDVLAVLGLFLLAGLRVRAFIESGFLIAAVPAEFRQYDWFAGARHLAHDALQISQVRQFVFLAPILIAATLRWVEMNLQEVQKLRLPVGPIPGV